MHARRIAIALGALVLALGLAGGAQASLQVDVTYDLDDSTMVFRTTRFFPVCGPSTDPNVRCDENGTLSGEMTVRYTGTSTGSGIKYGSAAIQAFDVTVKSFKERIQQSGSGAFSYTTFTQNNISGTFGWHLGSAGGGTSLNTAGLLGGSALKLQRTMSAHCLITPTGHCPLVLSMPASTPRVKYFSADASPTHSTGVFGFNETTTTGGDSYLTGGTVGLISLTFNSDHPNLRRLKVHGSGTHTFNNGDTLPYATFVGREIARTPEPGSLLLLGSGLAGLGALGSGGVIGRRLRRRRREDA